MKKQRRNDLAIRLQDDGRVLVSSQGTGFGARVPAFAVGVLAFCTLPRSREDVTGVFGPQGAALFDGLVEAELLVHPDQALETPRFFENFASLDVHRRMLDDTARVEAYRHAIEVLITAQTVVLDAGTGSGILATLAALSGAKQVYAVDNAEILSHARVVFADSGFSDRITAVRGDFASVDLPEPIDVIVTETFGILALAEGAARDLSACCERNLGDSGVVCPSAVSIFFAPVIQASVLDQALGPFERWQGVNMSSLRTAQLRRGFTLEVAASAMHGEGQLLSRLRFPEDAVEAHGDVHFDGTAGVQIYGLVGWFDLQLATGVVLGTGPNAPLTHWQQCFLPMDLPVLDADFEATIHVVPADGDRRSLEVTVDWRAGGQQGRLDFRLR